MILKIVGVLVIRRTIARHTSRRRRVIRYTLLLLLLRWSWVLWRRIIRHITRRSYASKRRIIRVRILLIWSLMMNRFQRPLLVMVISILALVQDNFGTFFASTTLDMPCLI
jgi:hypothetical protein